MQFRSDFTKEELLNGPDPINEIFFPISKLKLVAAFFDRYRLDYEFDDDEREILNGASYIIEDAAKEIEYLIQVSGEQYHLKRKEGGHGND